MKLPSLRSLVNTNVSMFRYSSYLAVLVGTALLVLLPVSVAYYLSFYRLLIPVERLHIPSTASWKSELREQAVYMTTDSTTTAFLEEYANVTFLLRLNLKAFCYVETLYHDVPYQLQLADKDIKSTILVNCDSRYIYVKQNRWIPYNLRYWVPPIFVDVFKSVLLDYEVVSMQGHQWLQALQEGVTFTFQRSLLKYNPKDLLLDLVVEWDGFRYYLVNYYFTSMLAGAGAFWILSSIFSFLSALVVFGCFKYSPTKTV